MTPTRKIAVVCGATRGAGRGIARALGEAGYRVIATGRSRTGAPSPYGMPETLDETVAGLPDAIAMGVDHAVEAEVKGLFERVVAEHGAIDVIVDSVAGEDPSLGGWTGLIDSDLTRAEEALRQALLTRLFTARHAAATLRAGGRGLLVEVTEYDLPFGSGGNLVSAVTKTAIKSMIPMLAEELRGHGVTAVAITPGFLRSESVLRHFGVTADTWRDGIAQDPHVAFSESPAQIGRGVAALAADPRALARTGEILSSWQLARDYDLTDVDGTRPDWGEHWRRGVVPTMPDLRAGIEHQAAWLEGLARRAREQLDPR